MAKYILVWQNIVSGAQDFNFAVENHAMFQANQS